MNLKRHLLLRMTAVGVACWLAVSGYVVAQSGGRSEQELAALADQLQALLQQDFRQRVTWGDATPESAPLAGIAAAVPEALCLRYWARDGSESELGCGVPALRSDLPAWLAAALSYLGPGSTSARREIRLWSRQVGTLQIIPYRGPLLERQWRSVRELLAVTALTLLALELLVLWVIRRAFRSTGDIVRALEELGEGVGELQLKGSQPQEFERIAEGIRRLAQRLHEVSNERAALTARLIGLQESERRELAHELHEDYGQLLAALAARIAGLRQGLAAGEGVTEADVQPLQALIEEMQAVLRALLQRMSSPPLEQQGLVAAIEELVIAWQVRLRGQPRISFSARADAEVAPSDERALCAYRVVQECLGNIARHAAGCGEARVELRVAAAALNVRVSNDLPDAGSSMAGAGTGMGLKLLRERVQSLRGVLSVQQSPSEFAVEAALPRASP